MATCLTGLNFGTWCGVHWGHCATQREQNASAITQIRKFPHSTVPTMLLRFLVKILSLN